MNVLMAGIDYSLAAIEIRERFSFTQTVIEQLYGRVLEHNSVLGAVILSTCNRTEIYLSCKDHFYINPFKLLCDGADLDFACYETLHRVKTGNAVIQHLCQLSCGVKSQIWGEDQIITQVKNAIGLARELKTCDSTLEVMFRNAIAAAKKVKTTLKLGLRDNSIVHKALEILKSRKELKEILVIGNGEIGRLMTEVLVENGYSVSMTLRQYRHGVNKVPLGANMVDYSDRYEKLADCDAVISATLSPHQTIEMDKLLTLERYPSVFIDLAVPRDIDSGVQSLPGAVLYDVDSISAEELNKNHEEQMTQVEKIIEKYIYDYENWCAFKERLVCV